MVAIGSFGGIKLKDNINYNRKVIHYNGLTESFKSKRKDNLANYYLPKWEDNVRWKKQLERGINSYRSVPGIPFNKRFPDIEALKNFCYKEATKDQNLNSCNPSTGWCDICARDESWS